MKKRQLNNEKLLYRLTFYLFQNFTKKKAENINVLSSLHLLSQLILNVILYSDEKTKPQRVLNIIQVLIIVNVLNKSWNSHTK